MVFCCKLLTESPTRCTSPRKGSMEHDYVSRQGSGGDHTDDVLALIPDHDWRLLAALARKKLQEKERNKLAEEFRKMWRREKEERDMVEAEMSEEYTRYLQKKRRQERCFQEYKRSERAAEQQAKRGQLLNSIWYKERRSADLLATEDDKKMLDLIDKVLKEETRARLVADRRNLIGAANEERKLIEFIQGVKKASDANTRRNIKLKDASQRLAINRVLCEWETQLIRQEVAAQDELRRAQAIARNVLVDRKSYQVARAKEIRQQRGRTLAAVTAKLRSDIMNDKYF